jgi:outer membrane translocation and assembly module TamA
VVAGTVELIRDIKATFGVAVFVDAGNAFDSFQSVEVAASAGLGVRWRLPGITLGIDVAQAFQVPSDLRATGTDPGPRLHVNFSPEF